MTSSVAVFEAAIRVKNNVYDKIVTENKKEKEKLEIKESFFYTNLYLKEVQE